MTLAQLKNRIVRMLGRAIIQAVEEQGGRQFLVLDVGDGDRRERVERLQNFGHHSWPPEHCDAVYAALAANRSTTVAVSAQDPRRPALKEPGDSAIYGVAGNTVYCHADGTVEIKASNGKPIIFSGPAKFLNDVDMEGKLHVLKQILSDEDVLAGLISLTKHKTTGVTPGSGVSGVPTP